MTPLGRAMERAQSQCLNATAVKEFGPQEIVHFNLIRSGMGSSLHTWMYPLCHAAEHNKVLVTGSKTWIWNDMATCSDELSRKQTFKPSDWPEADTRVVNSITSHSGGQKNMTIIPQHSALWCYFGWHESALRCPPGTLAWKNNSTDYGNQYKSYRCDKAVSEYGRSGVLSAVAEWLFQNVSQLVIREAERQIREEAFPPNATITSNSNSNSDSAENAAGDIFQRWPGLPDADSLITVHIRWGDKAREMKLVSMEEVINGTQSLLTPDELAGNKVVHVYVATEDPSALEQFRQAVIPMNWQVHASGPTNPSKGSHNMMSAADSSQGRAGLESLAALLISLEANRYVLATGSNWSRLINELRKSVVDSRCGNCTQIIDLRYKEEK
jgi:hypothetical protein